MPYVFKYKSQSKERRTHPFKAPTLSPTATLLISGRYSTLSENRTRLAGWEGEVLKRHVFFKMDGIFFCLLFTFLSRM